MDLQNPNGSGVAAAPVSTGERIELLDVVRGFALFGVLVGNLLWTGTAVARSDAQLAALSTAGIDRWANALWVKEPNSGATTRTATATVSRTRPS